MNRFALLCPGQGAQTSQMFDMANTSATTAAWLQISLDNSIAGKRLADVLAIPELLFENLYAQTLIVTATLANWLALREHLPQADLVAGYSIGEFAAHAVSGSLDVDAVLALATSRAAMMQACITKPQGMLAVSGIPLDKIAEVAQQHQLHIAIVTAANKVIVAGLSDDIAEAAPLFRRLPGQDVNLTEIAVHVASHTPLMQPAQQVLSTALDVTAFRDNAVPVLAGVNAEKVCTGAQIRSSLLAQLSNTIHWDACMDAIAENNISFALELGPGSALSAMLRARHPHIVCRSVADFRSLDGVIKWVQRQYES